MRFSRRGFLSGVAGLLTAAVPAGLLRDSEYTWEAVQDAGIPESCSRFATKVFRALGYVRTTFTVRDENGREAQYETSSIETEDRVFNCVFSEKRGDPIWLWDGEARLLGQVVAFQTEWVSTSDRAPLPPSRTQWRAVEEDDYIIPVLGE